MEFLIAALVLIVGVYFGWSYYQAKKATTTPYVLPEEAVVELEPIPAAVATVEPVETKAKKPAAKKAKADTETTAKKAPAKKKPNIKIAK